MLKDKGQFCFKHSAGEDIYLFTLRNANAEISIINYGAIITSFKVKQPGGNINDIVLGFDHPEDYLAEEYLAEYPYFGAAIGRYANRIKNGQFSIDEKFYPLAKNRGTDHLHGGRAGFDKKVWKCDHYSNNKLVLKYRSKDGEEGYPGNLDITIRFELNNNELLYEFFANTDAPTTVNLTHHSYFNLNNGKGEIGDHTVKVNSSYILEQDDNLVVTGKKLAVQNTPYDFRIPKRINKEWPAIGYDQTFVLDENLPMDLSSGLSFAADAFSEKSNLKLEVYTSEPVVHFYTGKWIPVLKGKNGNQYGPFSGFCLETQKHPNAINISHFPNTILRPGETYHTKTMYRIIT